MFVFFPSPCCTLWNAITRDLWVCPLYSFSFSLSFNQLRLQGQIPQTRWLKPQTSCLAVLEAGSQRSGSRGVRRWFESSSWCSPSQGVLAGWWAEKWGALPGVAPPSWPNDRPYVSISTYESLGGGTPTYTPPLPGQWAVILLLASISTLLGRK